MGMDPAEFWSMSWRDFQLKQRGFFELENERYKRSWEQARFIGFTANGFRKKGSKMTDLIKFDWEYKDVEYPTKEELRWNVLKYGKYLDENGKGYNA